MTVEKNRLVVRNKWGYVVYQSLLIRGVGDLHTCDNYVGVISKPTNKGDW